MRAEVPKTMSATCIVPFCAAKDLLFFLHRYEHMAATRLRQDNTPSGPMRGCLVLDEHCSEHGSSGVRISRVAQTVAWD